MKKVLVVGSCVVDLSFYAKRIPLVGETIRGRFEQGLGGKGFNQATASIKSGAPTRFISAVGSYSLDPFSRLFDEKLKSSEIEFALEQIENKTSGAATISIDERGQNSIIVSLGANEFLSPKFLAQKPQFFRDVGVLLLQFETNFAAIEQVIELTKKLSPEAFIILNPAPALPDIPQKIMDNIDLLTPNETEIEIISGGKSKTDTDLAHACAQVVGPKAILVTLGERGSFLFSKQNERHQNRFFSAFPVTAVDTAGAGDAFNGAFACAWLKTNGNLEQSVRFASAVAGLSVTRQGTSASLPDKSDIEVFLQHNSSVLL